MYYFGTNLDNRFAVPGFWPTQQQSNRVPFEREEIEAEVKRIAKQTEEVVKSRRKEEAMLDVSIDNDAKMRLRAHQQQQQRRRRQEQQGEEGN